MKGFVALCHCQFTAELYELYEQTFCWNHPMLKRGSPTEGWPCATTRSLRGSCYETRIVFVNIVFVVFVFKVVSKIRLKNKNTYITV